MPDHSWVCFACKTKNPPYTEVCRDCGIEAAVNVVSASKLSSELNNADRSSEQSGIDTGKPVVTTGSSVNAKLNTEATSFVDAAAEPNPDNEIYFASTKSTLAKVRTYTYVWIFVGLGISIIQQGGLSSGLFLVTGMMLLMALPLEWFFRKQLRPGQPLVTLSSDAIEAPNLSGSQKKLRWLDIEKVALGVNQGNRFLTFHLGVSAGEKIGKNFWTGNDPAKPTLGLAALLPNEQERLLDSVLRRHREAMGTTNSETGVPVNELTEEREFHERIKALEPHTWVTYTLIAANVLIWLATLFYGAAILQTPADKLLVFGGNAASEVQKGEWWRLLSATFLHSGILHIAMNMIGLYSAGVVVERIYGPRLFLIVYFGAGLLGSALSLHFSAQQAVSVGASGAVFGVAGALLVAVFQHRDKLPKSFSKQTLSGMGFFVFYSLLQGMGKLGIDNAAHVGGLIGGCMVAFILPERFDMAHYQKTFRNRAFASLAILGLTAVTLGAKAPLASVDQGKIVASAPLLDKTFNDLGIAMKALEAEQNDIKSGKITEREADERSRSVYAPMFKAISTDFSKVVLRPGEPRTSFINDVHRMTDLLTESLSMESVFNKENGKYEPVDPARSAKIEAELKSIDERIRKMTETARKKK